MRPAIEVTQADREAAAKWAKMQGRPHQAANMRRGACDTAPLVQAFARHRLAAIDAVVKWLREEARMARIRRADPDAALQAYADGLDNGADAIEAGEPFK